MEREIKVSFDELHVPMKVGEYPMSGGNEMITVTQEMIDCIKESGKSSPMIMRRIESVMDSGKVKWVFGGMAHRPWTAVQG